MGAAHKLTAGMKEWIIISIIIGRSLALDFSVVGLRVSTTVAGTC